jgi:hypothetical protein
MSSRITHRPNRDASQEAELTRPRKSWTTVAGGAACECGGRPIGSSGSDDYRQEPRWANLSTAETPKPRMTFRRPALRCTGCARRQLPNRTNLSLRLVPRRIGRFGRIAGSSLDVLGSCVAAGDNWAAPRRACGPGQPATCLGSNPGLSTTQWAGCPVEWRRTLVCDAAGDGPERRALFRWQRTIQRWTRGVGGMRSLVRREQAGSNPVRGAAARAARPSSYNTTCRCEAGSHGISCRRTSQLRSDADCSMKHPWRTLSGPGNQRRRNRP